MIINVPKQDRPGLHYLLSLDAEEAEALLQALNRAQVSLHKRGLVTAITSQVPDIKQDAVTAIVDTVYSMQVAISYLDLRVDQFVDGVLESVSGDDDFEKSGSFQLEKLKTRLQAFLRSDGAIATSAKVKDLITEHARIYTRARVMTDARPIFSKDGEVKPIGFVVVHTLKIEHFKDGSSKGFFVALDSDDVRSLQEVLKRAEKKAQTLSEALGEADLQFFDVDKQEED